MSPFSSRLTPPRRPLGRSGETDYRNRSGFSLNLLSTSGRWSYYPRTGRTRIPKHGSSKSKAMLERIRPTIAVCCSLLLLWSQFAVGLLHHVCAEHASRAHAAHAVVQGGSECAAHCCHHAAARSSRPAESGADSPDGESPHDAHECVICRIALAPRTVAVSVPCDVCSDVHHVRQIKARPSARCGVRVVPLSRGPPVSADGCSPV